MIPEISEFSYGFALTNELVGWLELFAAPIFPSLIEEGRSGGGYDVKLDRPGAPLYLQFKRAECMTRRSAREYRRILAQGGLLPVPFYRFPITVAATSDQHEMLLALDSAPNHVFYAAPRFHQLSEINDAWHANAVAGRSVFVAPSEIGSLDDDRHTVAFDRLNSWVCSDPRPIRALTSREVLEKLQNTLRMDDRPLRARLPGLVPNLRDAQRRGHARIAEKRRQADQDTNARQAARAGGATSERVLKKVRDARALPTLDDLRRLEVPEPAPPMTRASKALEQEYHTLREASDIAARIFDAQLVVVQPVE